MWTTQWPGFPEIASEMNRLREEMNRVFAGTAYSKTGSSPQRGLPPLNVWEDDETVFVEVELPGVDLEAIEIFINGDNQLTLQGERQKPATDEGTWHRQERSFGKFVRMLELPSQVDAARVTAESKHGVLTITMPKKEEVRPKRINITAVK